VFESFAPEEELLLCCARTHLEPHTVARIHALLEEDLDWNRLVSLARKHMTVQLLYWHLTKTAPNAVPAEIIEELRADFHRNLQASLFLTGELRGLLRLFDTNNIPVIPLKGPVLAQQIYKNVALRAFKDLDILIRKQDFVRAKEALAGMGYVPPRPWGVREELHLRSGEYVFVKSAYRRFFIDVHYELARGTLFRFPGVVELLENASVASVLGEKARTLSSEDLLLYSCVHLAKHAGKRLLWCCDIAEIIRTFRDLDWDLAIEKAQKANSKRALFSSLLLASDLLEAPLPQRILDIAKHDACAGVLADHVESQLFKETRGSAGVENIYCLFMARERIRDKIRVLLSVALMPTPSDYDALPLPAPLVGLYYIIRAVRLALLSRSWGPQLIKSIF
jgi:Uncharacterised nucleotidyltransferase